MVKERWLESVDSEGGPLVVVPAAVVRRWRGTLPPKGARVPKGWEWGQRGGPTCDYDRANDEREDDVRVGLFAIGMIPLGKARVLLLESSNGTSFCPCEGGGVFVRGAKVTAPLVLRAVANVKKWKKTRHVMQGGPFVIFDSALPGERALKKCVRGELPKGRFSIDAAETKEDDGWLTLIRATKV